MIAIPLFLGIGSCEIFYELPLLTKRSSRGEKGILGRKNSMSIFLELEADQ